MNSWPAAQISTLAHLQEFESAESAERTMSGHCENVEALCMRLWGETLCYVSSYDIW